MLTSYTILLSSFLAISLALVVEPVSAQSTGDPNRERSVIESAQTSSAVPNGSARQFTSSEATAEAKRLFKAGQKYGDAGLFSQAADLFLQALKIKPDYADAYASLGHAYFDMKQWDKAIPALEQALILNPKHKDTRQRLAAARLEAERNKTVEQVQPASSDASVDGNRNTPAATKVSSNEAALTKIYRVGPGDVLDVKFGEASGTYTVTTAGLLDHPNLSQPVPVAGRTVEEIANRVQSTLNLRAAELKAKVTVTVADYVSHRILVSGLVKEPGLKILRREAIPLSVVIADAQRLPDATRAKVVRNETNEVFTIELANDVELGSAFARPGDVITLEADPVQFFYVGGEVKSPGEKVFRRGLTLTQAILAAGGLVGKAKEVRLGRDNGTGFLTMSRYKLEDIESGKQPDPLIQPGDRITILK